MSSWMALPRWVPSSSIFSVSIYALLTSRCTMASRCARSKNSTLISVHWIVPFLLWREQFTALRLLGEILDFESLSADFCLDVLVVKTFSPCLRTRQFQSIGLKHPSPVLSCDAANSLALVCPLWDCHSYRQVFVFDGDFEWLQYFMPFLIEIG